MKKQFLKEEVLGSYLYFVWDCSHQEFSEWVASKFGYYVDPSINDFGKMIQIDGNGTKDWIIFWDSKQKNKTTIAHELIHFCVSYFQFQNIKINKHTEEVFANLHSYYYGKILNLIK